MLYVRVALSQGAELVLNTKITIRFEFANIIASIDESLKPDKVYATAPLKKN